MQDELTGPSWPLDHTGEYFLVAVYPDGRVEYDGGHGDLEGVARARKLYQRIFNKPGTEFRAIRIVAIPDTDPPINDAAADLMAAVLNRTQ